MKYFLIILALITSSCASIDAVDIIDTVKAKEINLAPEYRAGVKDRFIYTRKSTSGYKWGYNLKDEYWGVMYKGKF